MACPIFVAEIGLQTTPDSWTESDQQHYLSAAIERLRAVDLWGISLYELREQQVADRFRHRES